MSRLTKQQLLAAMKVNMFFCDTGKHKKPHVHVTYDGETSIVSLDGELLSGQLDPKKLRILSGWLALREEEIWAAWNNAVKGKPFEKVEGF